MLFTTMEKLKKDTKQEYPDLSSTTMEEVQNTKTKPEKKLDFVFCIMYSTGTDLRPFLNISKKKRKKLFFWINYFG